MAAPAASGGGEREKLLLLSSMEAGNGGGAPAAAEASWRLNFDRFRQPEAHQERPPPHALHHCLGVLGHSMPPFSLRRLYRSLPWCLCMMCDGKFRLLFYVRSSWVYVPPV
jgi:hypothetical protein